MNSRATAKKNFLKSKISLMIEINSYKMPKVREEKKGGTKWTQSMELEFYQQCLISVNDLNSPK